MKLLFLKIKLDLQVDGYSSFFRVAFASYTYRVFKLEGLCTMKRPTVWLILGITPVSRIERNGLARPTLTAVSSVFYRSDLALMTTNSGILELKRCNGKSSLSWISPRRVMTRDGPVKCSESLPGLDRGSMSSRQLASAKLE
jgi:hypothetical protein